MPRVNLARNVETLVRNPEAGDYRVTGKLGSNETPASGMTAVVHTGGNAFMTIINPQSYDDGGLEWCLRYGDADAVRYVAASVIESFDYLLSDAISQKEAVERLRYLRHARADLSRTITGQNAQ